MNKLALYLITLLGLCLTQPMAHAMSVQWTDYGYDNNGNVTELYDGDSGEIVGQYEYDPYGNTIKAEGQAARENKIRFSTKEYDSSTGLYYYGYRYYDPVAGRWPSRDPIQERGGLNLYGFVRNDGVNHLDVLGLIPDCEDCEKKHTDCTDIAMTAYDGTIADIETRLSDVIAEIDRQVEGYKADCPPADTLSGDTCRIAWDSNGSGQKTVAEGIAAGQRAASRGTYNTMYASCGAELATCSAKRLAAQLLCKCK
jgi:RHS repeat-associated protein